MTYQPPPGEGQPDPAAGTGQPGYNPPPPPPPAAPQQPGYNPPPAAPGAPQQQWNAPPTGSAYPTPSSGFNSKAVDPMDWGILGAGLLIFIFSFTAYYKYSAEGESITNSAWHGFFGWFGVLLILVGTAAVAVDLFAPQLKLPAPARLVGLGAWALGTLCIILTLFIYPGSACYKGFCGSLGSGVDKGHGFAFWIILILALAGTVVSFLRFQQKGGKLPGQA